MIPTLGRIVIFQPAQNDGDIPLVGIITSIEKKGPLPENEKWDGEENGWFVNLHVFKRWGTEIEPNVQFDNIPADSKRTPRTWAWPPRV
jgi:hypothetical protein